MVFNRVHLLRYIILKYILKYFSWVVPFSAFLIATRQLILDANVLLFTPLHLFDNLRYKLQSDEQIDSKTLIPKIGKMLNLHTLYTYL